MNWRVETGKSGGPNIVNSVPLSGISAGSSFYIDTVYGVLTALHESRPLLSTAAQQVPDPSSVIGFAPRVLVRPKTYNKYYILYLPYLTPPTCLPACADFCGSGVRGTATVSKPRATVDYISCIHTSTCTDGHAYV